MRGQGRKHKYFPVFPEIGSGIVGGRGREEEGRRSLVINL